MGQKQKIMLMRILIDKSIEEEIYRKNYNKDVVVSFEEQEYIVEPPKAKVVNPEKDGEVETETESEPVVEEKVVKPKAKRVLKKKVEVDIEV